MVGGGQVSQLGEFVSHCTVDFKQLEEGFCPNGPKKCTGGELKLSSQSKWPDCYRGGRVGLPIVLPCVESRVKAELDQQA